MQYADPVPPEYKEHAGKIFAVKIVPKASLIKSKARQKVRLNLLAQLHSEIKIHKSLKNDLVVIFNKFFEDKEYVFIMLELCPNQTLSELVRRRKRLTEIEAQFYIYQLVKAVKYLHQHKVIHRDLKLGNLFLDEGLKLRVGDFGLATKVIYDGERKRTVCGTPNYIAPEILDSKGGHSYEVDYWAIGVILYTLVCGRPPFESSEVKQTYKKIRACTYHFPEHVNLSDNLKDFVRKCLVVDPVQRMNLDQMLQHEFFTSGKIPERLPNSTLVCPPTVQFAK